MSAIRAATVLTVWGCAYLDGAIGADELLTHVADTGVTAGVRAADPEVAACSGLPGPGSAGAGSIALLSLLKDGGRPRLVLPVPGDLRGLRPGSGALVAGLDAGAAVVLPSSSLVIVPEAGVWRVFPDGPTDDGTTSLARPYEPSILEAELALDDAIRTATSRLMSLDIARDTQRVRDQIADAMRADTVALPRGSHRSASALLAKVVSLQALLAVAARYQTGAVSRYELGAVDDALRPLAAAVRLGRLAAVTAACAGGTGHAGVDPGRRRHSDLPAYE